MLKNKFKKKHTFEILTREATTHIRNAQGDTLVSLFGVVSVYDRNFSFISFSAR